MELKCMIVMWTKNAAARSNRTFMELKLYIKSDTFDK